MSIPYDIAETIRQNKARYCRFLDTKQWAELIKLGLPDAKLVFHEPTGEVSKVAGMPLSFASLEAFAKTMAVMLRNAQTSHQVMNPEFTRVSDTQIMAVWATTDFMVFPPIFRFLPFRVWGHGHYYEVWQEHAGDWLLKEMVMKRSARTIPGLASMFVRL